ncbi:MAG: glycosyltransferase [Candidatus Gottesmanbacteria bacterium]
MKQTHRPLVSVIMPVHNAGKFLAPAIDSILKQTYKKIELIIVDDCSTDDSWKVITAYKKHFPTIIKVLHTKEKTNSAGNGATNFAIPHAKGAFIARMDADDISYPTRIEKQVAYLQANPLTILVGTQAMIIDKNGKITGKKSMPTTNKAIYRMYGVIHPIIHPSVMIRRSMLPDKNKIYAMKWDVNDDYYTFFSLLPYGHFANLPEYLLKYRIHGNNLSLQHPKQKFINSINIRMEAITKLHYAIPFDILMIMAIQFLIVSILPERLIVPLYMGFRGMNSPIQSIKKFSTHIVHVIPHITFPKIRYTVNG